MKYKEQALKALEQAKNNITSIKFISSRPEEIWQLTDRIKILQENIEKVENIIGLENDEFN